MSWSPDAEIVGMALNFQVALNILKVHDSANDAAQRALRRLLESIHAAFLNDGECVLTVTTDQMFVNRERVRHVHEVADLRARLERMGIGGFAFTSPPEPAALAAFVTAMSQRDAWEAPEDCYAEPVSPDLESHGPGSRTRTPERVYKRAIGEIRDIYHDARDRGELSVRRGRRLVGDIVETLVTDEQVLFAAMTIRDYDLYTFQHSVNVCILASALGTRIGLNRLRARELGVAALFHDVGKIKISLRILNKPGKFTPQEWEVMKTHPLLGARILLERRGLEPTMIRAVQVALEHHIRYDGSGYPELRVPAAPAMYSRIVTLCDCYDAMTSVRAYRQVPITPAVAMSYIWHQRGRAFDPTLTKVFVSMIGAYPPGSLVRLSDETLAVVVEGPRKEDVFRPVVRRWGGRETLDLAAVPELGVVASLDPAGLNLSDEDLQAHMQPAS